VARLDVDGVLLSLHLDPLERLGALHGDVTVALAQVVAVRTASEMWRELRGIRAPGTGFPYLIMLGTTRYRTGKDFCAVYRRGPGVVVDLADAEFSRLLVSVAGTGRAQALADRISFAVRSAPTSDA
jgi:hypothetical protein